MLTKLVTKISKRPGTRIMTRNLGVKASSYANSTVLESLKVGCNWQKVGCNFYTQNGLKKPWFIHVRYCLLFKLLLMMKAKLCKFLGSIFLGFIATK